MRTKVLPFEFQPVVQSETSKWIGFEALARPRAAAFCNPRPSPLSLLEVAERMGAQWELGRIARECICRETEELPSNYLVFINLNVTELANEQLFEQPALLRQANRIVFEITESAAIRDGVRFREQVGRLRGLGFRLAVDDLGAGYAGLEAAAGLQADFVKVDMGLTRSIERLADQAAVGRERGRVRLSARHAGDRRGC